MRRWKALAITWPAKATALLVGEHERARNDSERWLVGYEAAGLIGSLLDQIEMLAPLLKEDQIEEAAEHAKRFAATARLLRLAPKLARVEGRSPEEAATFERSATAIRGRL